MILLFVHRPVFMTVSRAPPHQPSTVRQTASNASYVWRAFVDGVDITMSAATGWKAFKKTWIVPEVYPLIAALITGVSVATYQISRKAFYSLDVSWDRQVRSGGVIPQYRDADEKSIEQSSEGFLSFLKTRSTSVFAKDTRVYETKRLPNPVYTAPVEAEVTE